MFKSEKPIVIYDGECNLCDKSVKYILKNEQANEIRFTHLKSPTGIEIMQTFSLDEEFDGVLFYEKEILYAKTEAVLRISTYLRFPSKILAHFFWVPPFIRDHIYDFIAIRRYKWFGKDECIIMDQRIKDRFI